MKTARVFTNGRSQAVRLPKEYRFKGREVYVKRFDDIVVLIPKGAPWASLVRSLDRFSEDFMDDREQPPSTLRESL
jgi:antitoxin VapB